MYKIIGADQKEYGPVSADELRKWIHEGRANAQTRVRLEGDADWRTLGTIPEFAGLFPSPVHATTPPAFAPTFPSHRRTNGMAIAGFVFSLFSIPCCTTMIFPLLGLVFSVIALAQTHRDPWQRGQGLAIAGLILSLLMLLAALFIWSFVGFMAGQNQSHQNFQL